LVSIELRDAEPANGPLQRVYLGSDEPADGRRHLRPQRNFAPTLVREAEQLRLYLFARLRLVQIQGLEHGCVVFDEGEMMRRLPPDPKEMIPTREILRIEFAEAGKGLKRSHGSASLRCHFRERDKN